MTETASETLHYCPAVLTRRDSHCHGRIFGLSLVRRVELFHACLLLPLLLQHLKYFQGGTLVPGVTGLRLWGGLLELHVPPKESTVEKPMSFSTTTNMVLDPTFAKKPQHFNLRPAEGDQSSAITAARTGKTRRGRRGGRGRSLTPRPGVGVASPAASETGALRKSDAGRWVATSDALGQPVQYHHLLTFPSQHHDRVIDCRTNIGAWGHQVCTPQLLLSSAAMNKVAGCK